MKKARRFKKKLALRVTKRKIESVFSVDLIGKEYFEKVQKLVKRFFRLPRTMNE